MPGIVSRKSSKPCGRAGSVKTSAAALLPASSKACFLRLDSWGDSWPVPEVAADATQLVRVLLVVQVRLVALLGERDREQVLVAADAGGLGDVGARVIELRALVPVDAGRIPEPGPPGVAHAQPHLLGEVVEPPGRQVALHAVHEDPAVVVVVRRLPPGAGGVRVHVAARAELVRRAELVAAPARPGQPQADEDAQAQRREHEPAGDAHERAQRTEAGQRQAWMGASGGGARGPVREPGASAPTLLLRSSLRHPSGGVGPYGTVRRTAPTQTTRDR